MNKRQIICLVVAMLVLGLVVALLVVRSQNRGLIRAASLSIGQDLIRTTNSTHLVRVGPYLRAQLSDLLASPTRVATVLLGDARSPDGDGSACSRLVLTNKAGHRLLIRLRRADRTGMFDAVGFRVGSD